MPPEAEPAEKAPWPPKDWVIRHEVSTATNWWDVGKNFSRDPWDIIFFNFQTYDWRVVNWYMREKLGCTLVSDDGKSYRFGKAGVPGFKTYVYIPVNSWKAPSKEDENAREVVRAALFSYRAKNLTFNIYGYVFRHAHMAALDFLIAQRALPVRFSNGSKANFKGKKGTVGEFLIPYQTASYSRQADVIREALGAHAFLNGSDTAGLSTAELLGAMFVGQHLFLIAYGQPKPVWIGPATQAIMDIAWKIATDMRTKLKYEYTDANALLTMIKAHPGMS